jgi:hypothetical protein
VNEYAIVPSAAARLTGRALGIDVGGSGIKAAVVDVASGQFAASARGSGRSAVSDGLERRPEVGAGVTWVGRLAVGFATCGL